MAAEFPEALLVAAVMVMLLCAGSMPVRGAAIQTVGHPASRNFNDWARHRGFGKNGFPLYDKVPGRRNVIIDSAPPRQHYFEKQNEVRKYIIKAMKDENNKSYKEDRAHDKILNKIITCTNEQKTCLRYHRLHIPNQKGCFHLHWKSDNCTVYVDETHFKEKTKNFLRGKCTDMTEENGTCDNSVNFFLSQIFQGFQCPVKICSEGEDCQKLRFMEQPTGSVSCIFPDLRIDVLRMTTDRMYKVPVLMRMQAKCNAEGKVWRKKNGACYSLLERGPCSEDQILILNKTKYGEGNIVSTCVFERCGIGENLMAFDGKCHKGVESALMPGERLFLNWFGEWYVAPEPASQQVVKTVQFLPGE